MRSPPTNLLWMRSCPALQCRPASYSSTTPAPPSSTRAPSVVASGTATVQALTIGNPFVVVYRVSALTFALAKRMVRYPAEIPAERDADGNLPVAMVNLIAGRRIVPELLNRRFTAANLVAALRPLLDETPERRQMIADARRGTRAGCCPRPATDPIHRVCNAVEELLRPTDPAAHPEPPQQTSNLLGLNKRPTSGACIQSAASRTRLYDYS